MLAVDRKREVLRLLERQGTLRVTDLAQRFGVTEETIRRDLDDLQEEGYLRRVHGGAISLRSTDYEAPLGVRAVRNLAAKRAIARAALQLVEEDDTLILDASTTVLQLAAELPDISCTAVTNSLNVAAELASRSHVEVVFLGGRMRKWSMSFVGPYAQRALQEYRADKVFLSCKGLDLEFGVSESNELEADLKRVMVAAGRRVILLADSSKLGQTAFARLMPVEGFHTLITDAQAEPKYLDALRERHIEVLVAPIETA